MRILPLILVLECLFTFRPFTADCSSDISGGESENLLSLQALSHEPNSPLRQLNLPQFQFKNAKLNPIQEQLGTIAMLHHALQQPSNKGAKTLERDPQKTLKSLIEQTKKQCGDI